MGCCASTPVENTTVRKQESPVAPTAMTDLRLAVATQTLSSPNPQAASGGSIDEELFGIGRKGSNLEARAVSFPSNLLLPPPTTTPTSLCNHSNLHNITARYLPLTPPAGALSCPTTAEFSGSYGNVAQVPMAMPNQSPRSLKSSRRTLKRGSSIYAAVNPLDAHPVTTETTTVLTVRDEEEVSEACAVGDRFGNGTIPSPNQEGQLSPSAPTIDAPYLDDSRPLLSLMNAFGSQSGAGLRRDTESVWVDSEAMTVRMQNVIWGETQGLYRSPLASCGATQSMSHNSRNVHQPPAAPLTAMSLAQICTLDTSSRPQFVQAVNTWRLSVAVAAKHAAPLE